MKSFLSILLLIYSCLCFSQKRLEYGDFIQLNRDIHWAAETDAFLNLMPKTAKYSIKNLYLRKLKDSGIIVYKINSDKYSVTSEKLTINSFEEKKFDTVLNANLSNESYPVILDTDSVNSRHAVCLCDSCARGELFEIFKVKQIVCYGNSQLFIKNILISPLCLKRNRYVGNMNDLPVWDVLFNTAFSNGNEITSKKEHLLYLGEEDYYYDLNEFSLLENRNLLTLRSPSLIQLILSDCKKGKLKLFDPEKGREIPYVKLKSWGLEKIAVPVYDDLGNTISTKFIMPERNFDSLNRFRIKQELFFDTKKEVLISVVKSVDILEPVFTSIGIYLGNSSIFRIYPKNKK